MRASVINRFAKNITAVDANWTRRSRRLALAVPLAAVAAVGLVGCNNPQQHGTAASQSATPVAQPSPSASASASPFVPPSPSAVPSPSASASASAVPVPVPVPVKLNGTAHNGLTISNGTRYVVMGGKVVDFGTAVRDLAWSPDGRNAAFIDGAGDLVISKPDGSNRTVVAKKPGGQTWSHPTWQVTAADPGNYEKARNNLVFTVTRGGTARLERIPATAVDGTPQQLAIGGYQGSDAPDVPQTGNTWVDMGGPHARGVFENTGDGKVYIRDEYLRTQSSALTAGSEPAISAEGEVVFVRSVGGHDHLFEYDFRAMKPKDLTPHATTDYTEPAFSADGRTIAVRTPDGISTLPADGSAAPTRISDYTGLPAYRHA